MLFSCRFSLAFPLVVALIAGCGSKNPNAPAKISGIITYREKVLTGGTITFWAKDGGAYRSQISSDGTYELADLPIGDYAVAVETETINPDKKMPEYGGGRAPTDKNPAMSPAPKDAPKPNTVYIKINPKFGDKATSGLSASLTAGSNNANFDLKDN